MRKVRKSNAPVEKHAVRLTLAKSGTVLMIGLNPLELYASKVVGAVLGSMDLIGERRLRIRFYWAGTSGQTSLRMIAKARIRGRKGRIKGRGELVLVLTGRGRVNIGDLWRRRMHRLGWGCAVLLVTVTVYAGNAHASNKKTKPDRPTAYYTPMPLDSGFGPMNLSDPPIAAEEIVKQFTAKESGFREALNHYTYRRTVRTQTITEDGKVDGEYYEIDDVIFDLTGKRVEKVVYAPANTLTRISMSPADFKDLQERLPFVLTDSDAGQYDIKYIGRQKVDDVECYVFEVSPKVMEKGKRYFQGKIWVDSDEMEIVVTSGKNVPDDLRSGHEDLSTPFTTYREQIDGTNWFPTYTKGDGVLHFPGGKGYLSQDVHIRQTVKYSDYKQYGTTTKIVYDGQEISDKPESKKPDGGADGKTPTGTGPK